MLEFLYHFFKKKRKLDIDYKLDRLYIYKEALKRIDQHLQSKQFNKRTGFCEIIRDILREHGEPGGFWLQEFPELFKYEPITLEPYHYWYSLSKRGMLTRRNILLAVIKEIEK